MANIQEGSVVRLKSGGPKMTVTEGTDEDGKVFCQWFSGDIMQENIFLVSSLAIVEEFEGKTK